MSRVDGKVALVTGGGSGIGRAIAVMLAAEGASVAVTDINPDGAQATVDQIKNDGNRGHAFPHDVSSEEDWQRVLQATKATFGPLQILVNNAGLLLYRHLAETSVEDWHKLMNVNALGTFLGMKHGAPLMADGPGGSIINVSSTAGIVGVERQVLYGATKGAVRTMTKDAAIEYASQGVRINSVHPSIVDTGMADYATQERGKSKEEIAAMYPLGRIGMPHDVAYAVLYLASDESSFMTGSELVLDGGYTAK
ncbi:MAG: SDR family NAD(P)-dependent oxidoreductase [Elainellaceae cyanobacterium]